MLSKLAIKLDCYRYLLYALTLCSLIVSIKISSILIAIIFLQWLVLVPTSEKRKYLKLNRKYWLIFVGFFSCYLISLLWTENLGSGWKDIESKLSFVLLPVAILGQKPLSKFSLNSLFAVFSWFVLGACLLAITISLIQAKTVLANQELAILIGMHASYLSLYGSFALFYFIRETFSQSSKILNGLAAFFLIASLLFLSARMVLLATFLAAGAWVLFFQFNWKRLIALGVGVIILSVAALNIEPIKKRFKEGFDQSEKVEFGYVENKEDVKNYGGKAIRFAIWYCITDLMKEKALIGVGAGDVHENLQASYKEHEFQLAWQFNNYNTHNLFFETIIGVGITGIAILLALFYTLFLQAIKSRSLIYFSFTALFFLFSLIEASFNVQRGFVFFILLSVLLIANFQLVKKDFRKKNN